MCFKFWCLNEWIRCMVIVVIKGKCLSDFNFKCFFDMVLRVYYEILMIVILFYIVICCDKKDNNI